MSKFFYEFCTINMQKWTNFKNKRYKYNRILQDLKKNSKICEMVAKKAY